MSFLLKARWIRFVCLVCALLSCLFAVINKVLLFYFRQIWYHFKLLTFVVAGLETHVVFYCCRTYVVTTAVTHWAWPMWGRCVTPKGAARSSKTMACKVLSRLHTSLVSGRLCFQETVCTEVGLWHLSELGGRSISGGRRDERVIILLRVSQFEFVLLCCYF